MMDWMAVGWRYAALVGAICIMARNVIDGYKSGDFYVSWYEFVTVTALFSVSYILGAMQGLYTKLDKLESKLGELQKGADKPA